MKGKDIKTDGTAYLAIVEGQRVKIIPETVEGSGVVGKLGAPAEIWGIRHEAGRALTITTRDMQRVWDELDEERQVGKEQARERADLIAERLIGYGYGVSRSDLTGALPFADVQVTATAVVVKPEVMVRLLDWMDEKVEATE